jgi:hypothetical protein
VEEILAEPLPDPLPGNITEKLEHILANADQKIQSLFKAEGE